MEKKSGAWQRPDGELEILREAVREIAGWLPGYYDNRDNSEADRLSEIARDARKEVEALKAKPGPVDAERRYLLCLYRIDEAISRLEARDVDGMQGIGWAAAHHALQKAKMALGLELGPDPAITARKAEVKAIEQELYDERRAEEKATPPGAEDPA